MAEFCFSKNFAASNVAIFASSNKSRQIVEREETTGSFFSSCGSSSALTKYSQSAHTLLTVRAESLCVK